MQRLLRELELVTARPPLAGDLVALAEALVTHIAENSPYLAILLWKLEADAPVVTFERGLRQFSTNGKFHVTAMHLDFLCECQRLDKGRTLTLPCEGPNDPAIRASVFPVTKTSTKLIVEFLRNDPSPNISDDAIEVLGERVCELLIHSERISSQPASDRITPNSAELIDTVGLDKWNHFLTVLYEQVSSKQVAMVAATDGRTLIGCDRVSVLIYRGNRSKPLAISHVESIRRRSGLVRAIRALATSARFRTRSFIVQGEGVECPIDMLDEFSAFVAESRSQSLAIFPLIPTDELDGVRHALSHRKQKAQRSIGVLIVEQFTASEEFSKPLGRAETLIPHISNALRNAVEYESVFMLPFWRWIGSRLRWLFGYPKWAIASVISTIFIVCVGLALIPATYRVHADGKAMPEIQHEIYAKVDGIVDSILVTSGQRVKRGDIILRLDNKELELELEESRNKVVELGSQVTSLGVRLEAARLKGDVEVELATEGERAASMIELEGTIRRVTLLEERIQRLNVVSEFDGVVATFQPNEFLAGRPVRQGDRLLEVMDDEGPWRLELEIAEYRIGHVLRGLHQHDKLDVRYIAMTDVSSPKYGTLETIATRADHDEAKGVYVRAFASIAKEDIPNQRIGAEISAKIRCPGYSLFYCLLGDVVEFLQRNLWW